MKHIIPIIIVTVISLAYVWAEPDPVTPLMSIPNDPKFASDGWFLGKYRAKSTMSNSMGGYG
jgi:hypothetical protein